MNPKIFKPNQDLKEFVKSYWTLEGTKDATPNKNTIVPDGTMKLIFHYGDLYWHHPENGDSFLQPRCFLIGQLTKPYIVEPDGDTGTFVVRFHPNGFSPFTTIPIKEMENTPISLERLFGKEGQKLEFKILNANGVLKRIEIIESFLLSKLKNKKLTDKVVKSTIKTITTANGQIPINELSKQGHLNRRVLSRKFNTTVGLSPKQLSKIIRLQSSLKILLNKDISKLTDLAYENDYFDQAHFIKDFNEFTGTTPKEFYKDHLKMSLIFEKLN
ncbi:helix-turn-helix transcriptional regulator [Tenacibaculum ovolyticum]|uniref:helix-turn-helix transcriptional regulator n=1 Tax=Tenacibaculum ovolyticum TaxID=104270 RepID=UPI0003F5B049|nr:helix-turn-helix transcriptional regulator [Tenacibaculum ovolyticum]